MAWRPRGRQRLKAAAPTEGAAGRRWPRPGSEGRLGGMAPARRRRCACAAAPAAPAGRYHSIHQPHALVNVLWREEGEGQGGWAAVQGMPMEMDAAERVCSGRQRASWRQPLHDCTAVLGPGTGAAAGRPRRFAHTTPRHARSLKRRPAPGCSGRGFRVDPYISSNFVF